MPLFWQERKPKTLWAQLLKALRGKAVFDATPGSGQLARACLELGAGYTGVAKSQQHFSQLSPRPLRRRSRRTVWVSMLRRGPRLAKEHFQDVTEMLHQQDFAADTECKDGEEDVEVDS